VTHRWTSLVEALTVFMMIEGYIWWVREFYPYAWIPMLGFVLLSHAVRGESPGSLGFDPHEFRPALVFLLPWVVNIAMGLWGGGILLDTVRYAHPFVVLRNLAMYIVWGTFQQYVLNGYFTNRALQFCNEKSKAPLISALLFAAVHLPNWFLVAVTFVGGYFSARVFLRYRSVPALGVAHGTIGYLLLMALPDSVTGHLIVGPRYLLEHF
jgi:uncharacterized protein